MRPTPHHTPKVIEFRPSDRPREGDRNPKKKPKGQRADRKGKHIRRAVAPGVYRSFYGSSLAEAEEKWRAAKAAYEAGQGAQPEHMTVEEWGEKWYQTYVAPTSISEKSKEDTLRIVMKLCAQWFGRDVGSIKPSEAQQWLYEIGEGASDSHISKHLSVGNRMWRDALAEGLTDTNPFEGRTVPEGTAGTHRVLSDEEIAWVCMHWREHRMGLLALTYIFAGLRRGEAIALDWEDVDLDGRILHVNSAATVNHNQPEIGSTKTVDSNRSVYLVDVLLQALREVNPDGKRCGPVFLSARGKRLTQSASDRGWESFNLFIQLGRSAVGRRVGELPRNVFRSHDGRHTMRTMLEDAGVSASVAEEMLGHADEDEGFSSSGRTRRGRTSNMRKRYTHVTDLQRARGYALYNEFASKFLAPKKLWSNCGQTPFAPHQEA